MTTLKAQKIPIFCQHVTGLYHYSWLEKKIYNSMKQPSAPFLPCPALCPISTRCPSPPPQHSTLLHGVSCIPQGCQRERHKPFPRGKPDIVGKQSRQERDDKENLDGIGQILGP